LQWRGSDPPRSVLTNIDFAGTRLRSFLPSNCGQLSRTKPHKRQVKANAGNWVLGEVCANGIYVKLLTGRRGCAQGRDQYAALLPVYERVLGPEHPDPLVARDESAFWTGKAGDPAAARDQLAALLPVRERVLGPEHPDTLDTRYDLACWAREADGDPGAAEN
jgi:Tetratricopeptide repeat